MVVDVERMLRVRTTPGGKVSLTALQAKFVRMVALLIIKADELGYEFTFGDAYARSGHMDKSLHYSRLAIDLNLFKDGIYKYETSEYKELGEYWESIGGAWGGRFGDGNHFSLAYGGRK